MSGTQISRKAADCVSVQCWITGGEALFGVWGSVCCWVTGWEGVCVCVCVCVCVLCWITGWEAVCVCVCVCGVGSQCGKLRCLEQSLVIN